MSIEIKVRFGFYNMLLQVSENSNWFVHLCCYVPSLWRQSLPGTVRNYEKGSWCKEDEMECSCWHEKPSMLVLYLD